jgi:hypothetical protein
MIIGLCGLAQAGKDTAAQHLIDNYGFQRLAFADKLKDLSYLINPELHEAVDAVGWEATKKIPVFRRFLQDLGHSARLVFGDDFWVDQVLPQYDEFVEDIGNIVVTDMRYANEFHRVEWHQGWTVRIIRPGLKAPNNHVTETQHLDIKTSFEVINDSFESFYKQLDDVVFAIQEAEHV